MAEADIFTSLKSARKHDSSTDTPTEQFLTSVKSTRNTQKAVIEKSSVDRLDESTSAINGNITQDVVRKPSAQPPRTSSSPQDTLQLLRSQPTQDELIATLRQLHSHAFEKAGFNVHVPGPLQAQIINALVSTIVLDFWPTLQGEHERRDLLKCLENLAGLNAVIARLKLLSSHQKSPSSLKSSRDDPDANVATIRNMIDAAERLFNQHSSKTLFRISQNLKSAVSNAQKFQMIWKEFVNLIASGKVIAALAQAEDIVKASTLKKDSYFSNRNSSWLASGPEYAKWLGRNVVGMVIATEHFQGEEVPPKKLAAGPAVAQVLAKALNLGYSNQLLESLFTVLVPSSTTPADSRAEDTFKAMLGRLPVHSKRQFVDSMLRWLSIMAIPGAEDRASLPAHANQEKAISGLAALVAYIVSSTEDESSIRQIVISHLSDPTLSALLPLPVRRACLASLSVSESSNEDDLQDLLETLVRTFGDPLFISHAPVLQQEFLAQTILLTSGYVYRAKPMALLLTARSSNHMQGVSRRLDSSNAKSRWLGMVVGTAISGFVDKEGGKMDFGTDEMHTEEAKWYMELIRLEDKVGKLEDFEAVLKSNDKALNRSSRTVQETANVEKMQVLNGKPVFGPPRPPPPVAAPVQTEVVGEKVTEILDSDPDEDEDSDLKPYAKPDSDPEDSDEDATLVNRNKVRPPVYVRDLMSMLRDDKNFDRFRLGIQHAAALIRRKKDFGKEVKDHCEELGAIFVNLQNAFEMENFDELRLQAMIAVLLSDVNSMGPWFAKQAFVGEYSIAQRCVLLSALGLGGRELAGLRMDNADNLNPAIGNAQFPSKRLPPRLHSIYSSRHANASSTTRRLEAASNEIEHALIKPLALQAADNSTSHLNAVKVRTFSSRMDVERTKRKPTPNSLAQVFGSAFFFPLLTHYQREVTAYGSSSVYASVPILLVTLLKTLALLFHASGPVTLNLPEITSEFWDLLLSLRVQAVSDITHLQAVLFSLLTLLEMNTATEMGKKRIAQECPKQLMETQHWVDMVFERTGAGNVVGESGYEAGDEAKVRTLAAGVLVKTREVVQAYQKELVGYDFG